MSSPAKIAEHSNPHLCYATALNEESTVSPLPKSPTGLYLVVWPSSNLRKCKYSAKEMHACLNSVISSFPQAYQPTLYRLTEGNYFAIHQPLNETFDLNTLIQMRRTFEAAIKRFHIHTCYLISMNSQSIPYKWTSTWEKRVA